MQQSSRLVLRSLATFGRAIYTIESVGYTSRIIASSSLPHDTHCLTYRGFLSSCMPCNKYQENTKDLHGFEAEAEAMLNDPMTALMTGRGIPLGLAMKHNKTTGEEAARSTPPREAHAFTPDSVTTSATPAPSSYDLEALDQVIQASKQQDSETLKDVWGTTTESAAQIAARIAESNADSATSSNIDDMEPEQLSSIEAKFQTLEAMTQNIKGLDGVWEVLASVPWLDDNDIDDKELKGVAMFGLMGTLEDVGFKIREKIEKIWAGARDSSQLLEGTDAKEQAALISVLFHMHKNEEKYGAPPLWKSHK